jgi:hypothetical protein
MRKQVKSKRTRRFKRKNGTRRRKYMKGGGEWETTNGHQNAVIRTYGLANKTIDFLDTWNRVHRVSIYPNNMNMGTFIVNGDEESVWLFSKFVESPDYLVNNMRIVQ